MPPLPHRLRALPLALLSLAAAACDADPPAPAVSEAPASYEIVSLLGEELARPELPESFVAEQERLLAAAEADLSADPDDADALVWVGRRQAYLGRYRQAIETFTDGVERHPSDPRFLRHRGHRYITVRELDAAIEDLVHAAETTAERPDEIEPDGLPNERGIPTSTLQSNIYYHLGLAYYLKGDFAAARTAYERCLEVSPGADNVVATSHWLYMTLRRLRDDEAAGRLLEPISADLDIIENHEYHRLLLMYKGEVDAERLAEQIVGGNDSLGSATLGYGIGEWFLAADDRDRALSIFAAVLAGRQWAAFGYIAAEAEMSRATAYERDVHAWRQQRLERLLAEDGWLALVALFSLEPGEFSFGTSPEADFAFPGQTEPRLFGSLQVTSTGEPDEVAVLMRAAPGADVHLDGEPVTELEMVSDAHDGTSRLEVGPYRFYVIERSRRPFLRVLDLERPGRVEPPVIEHFVLDPSWRVDARFEPYQPPRTIPVPTILETTNQSMSPGALVFERDGVTHRLDAIDSGDDLFVIFADTTSGAETYGGGRYLYTDLPGDDGRVTLDFNRAYNPPCVFTDHATCPLPPRQNRLDLRIEAGEKMVEGYLEH